MSVLLIFQLNVSVFHSCMHHFVVFSIEGLWQSSNQMPLQEWVCYQKSNILSIVQNSGLSMGKARDSVRACRHAPEVIFDGD